MKLKKGKQIDFSEFIDRDVGHIGTDGNLTQINRKIPG